MQYNSCALPNPSLKLTQFNRIYFIISLILLSLTGCKSPVEAPLTAQEYFPLKSGNTWYYNTTNMDTNYISLVCSVAGQIKINGKQYFMITEHYLFTYNTDTVFYRRSGDTLFSAYPNSNEQILADFSLGLNDTAYWRHDLKVVQKSDNIIKFESSMGTSFYNITFKKGIGITGDNEDGCFTCYKRTLIKADIK